MSKARKCDRCGRCFDPRMAAGEMASFGNPVFQDGADYQKHVVGHYLLRGSPPEETVDLCPDCTTQFVIFMEKGFEGGSGRRRNRISREKAKGVLGRSGRTEPFV